MNNKDSNKNYFISLGILAIILFLVFRQIPVINDAWASYFFYRSWGGFLGTVIVSIKRYFLVNGRILATIICAFFEQNDILLDVGITITFISLIFIISRNYENSKKIFIEIVAISLLLCVSNAIMVEVYFYATLFYMIAVLIIVWSSDKIENYIKESNISKKTKKIAYLSMILSCSWIENVSVGILCSITIMLIIDFIKNRKINSKYISLWGLSLTSTFIILYSTVMTGTRELSYEGSKLLMINNNISIIYNELFNQQKVLIAALSIFAIVIVLNSNVSKWKKNSYCITMAIIAFNNILWFVLNYLGGIYIIERLDSFLWITDGQSITASIKFIIMIALFVIPIFAFDKEKFNKNLFLYMAGIFSLVPSIMTPNNTGARISSFAVFMLIIVYVNLLGKLSSKETGYKFAKTFVIIILLLGIDNYTITLGNIVEIQKIREFKIEQVKIDQTLGEWDYDKILYLPKFSNNALYCGASFGEEDVHYDLFKQYYGLDLETKIDYY